MTSRLARLSVSHAMASGAVMAVFALFGAASWVALFLWALVAGFPTGGPLAFPFLVLVAVATSAAALLILGPTTAVAALLRHALRWHRVTEIPIATLLMVGGLLSTAPLAARIAGSAVDGALGAAVIVAALLLAPLGVYWWSYQSVDALLRVVMKWKRDR